ncbi:hypothetical protein OF83DRAFT_866891 [Amylostereum chailletii]|nr:hypothetical protein OF83DRAFT_866891 [Amylostereum chailletii]
MPPTPTPPDWPIPKLTLRVEDLDHPGAKLFFDSVDPTRVLHDAVAAVFTWLYITRANAPDHVASIELVLRPMDGVAHCTGTHTAKEIHLSLQHVLNSSARAADEIRGVLTHETVHCFQHNANGTCPGGLIEGIADYVRLRAGFVPPHWTRTGGARWDAGYQTTGYFLGWLETRYGDGTVAELNAALKDVDWDERVFKGVTGRKVGKLWRMYCEELEGGVVI